MLEILAEKEGVQRAAWGSSWVMLKRRASGLTCTPTQRTRRLSPSGLVSCAVSSGARHSLRQGECPAPPALTQHSARRPAPRHSSTGVRSDGASFSADACKVAVEVPQAARPLRGQSAACGPAEGLEGYLRLLTGTNVMYKERGASRPGIESKAGARDGRRWAGRDGAWIAS